MIYKKENTAYTNLSDRFEANNKEDERLLNKVEAIDKIRREVMNCNNRHFKIKSFCADHLERFGLKVFQKNCSIASTKQHRNSGWFYKLQDEPVETKFGKMYIALLVSVKSDFLADCTAVFQECLIQVDETLEEGKQITKLGLGMWHLWDGKCFKEIDDCPLGEREEYSSQDFDKFIKKSFISKYL